MDDITNKRFDSVDARLKSLEEGLDTLRGGLAGVGAKVDDLRGEVIDRFRQTETRITTELHTVLGAVQDIKNWLVERDDTKTRLARLEEKFAQLERQAAKQ